MNLMSATSRIDIIVPVYRGLDTTRHCLASLFANLQKTQFDLIIVDDASLEPGMGALLSEFAHRPNVFMLRNEENLGFVCSVNRGMSLHADRDVVLLNSDTEVANDWLDRLLGCAYSQTDIGTVTPFSNNATICSYPVFCADNPMPSGIDLGGLDKLFKQVNEGKCVEIPTAVGFCMYIKRACLDSVGLFDAKCFGRGYGEENDFSRRAVRAGWRNVLCGDTFVFHAGGVSFRNERDSLMTQSAKTLDHLHPDYQDLIKRFVAGDPPAYLRQAVDFEFARRRLGVSKIYSEMGSNSIKPVQLHIVHDLGGGIVHWYQDYCQADIARINLVLKPYRRNPTLAEGLMLFVNVNDKYPIRFWKLSEPIHVTVDTHSEYRKIIREIIQEYGVQAVLVSSLIGHALDIMDTGLPTLVINHDYFPTCPAINLFFDGVCGNCNDDRLALCIQNNSDFNPFYNLSGDEQAKKVRTQFLNLVVSVPIAMVVPNRSVREHLLRISPQLTNVPFVTIPHGYLLDMRSIPYTGFVGGRKLRIVVLGRLSVSKGVRLLMDALDRLVEFAEVHLVGAMEVGELFRDKAGVHVVSQYSVEELPAILTAIQPDVGLLLSIWPETFSYTLSELFLMAIPPAATNLGGFSDRIQPGETGYLFEPDADALLICLHAIHENRNTLRTIRSNLLAMPPRSAQEMVADYHRLLPLAGGKAEPDWLLNPRQALENQEAVLLSLELSRQWQEIDSLRLTLDMREDRLRALGCQLSEGQGVLVTQKGIIRQLESERDEKTDALNICNAQLAEIYASTSWACSKPVRWLGTALRKVRTVRRCLAPVLRQPTRCLTVGLDLYRAWRVGGMFTLKMALSQLPQTYAVQTGEPTDSPPALPEIMPALDWRDAAFQRYHTSFTDGMRAAIRARINAMPAPPPISILMPTYNTPEPMLRASLDSVQKQLYPYWELCIADDGSTSTQTIALLEAYASKDGRIKLHIGKENRGVSHATNRSLEMATGCFVVLLDHDDMLEEQALFRVAEAVLEDEPDMLYSDEILVSEDGASVQHFIFRPVFSPEYLRSHPYIVHMVGFKPELLRQIGGFDETLRISQDYDLILRVSEQARTITHIPEILYRWRTHGHSAGHQLISSVMATSKSILQRHLSRRDEAGKVNDGPSLNYFDVRYPLVAGLKVAIIIPTRNNGDLVRTCIESIKRTAGGIVYDIVLIDHDSDEPTSLAYFDSLAVDTKVLRYSGPFNFSAINNWAVAQLGNGYSHYLFCNNDVEAIHPGWLERMLELGQKPDVGIVGAKLYYPDRKTVQHAGVVVACCGVAENLGRFRLTSEDSIDLGYIGSLIVNREVSAVTAACLLIRRSVFNEIGGFDKALAVGYGDVDMCLRVRQLVYRILFCAHAELLHHESYTRGRHPEDPHPEDSAHFVAKWPDVFVAGDPYFNPNLSPDSPNWQVRQPLLFQLEVRRRNYQALVSH